MSHHMGDELDQGPAPSHHGMQDQLGPDDVNEHNLQFLRLIRKAPYDSLR